VRSGKRPSSPICIASGVLPRTQQRNRKHGRQCSAGNRPPPARLEAPAPPVRSNPGIGRPQLQGGENEAAGLQPQLSRGIVGCDALAVKHEADLRCLQARVGAESFHQLPKLPLELKPQVLISQEWHVYEDICDMFRTRRLVNTFVDKKVVNFKCDTSITLTAALMKLNRMREPRWHKEM